MTSNKLELLACIKALKQELIIKFENLENKVLALEEPQTQIIEVQADLDDWLPPKQICKRLSIGYTTFFEWVRKGKLPPGLSFDKEKRWRMSDIIAWREEKQNNNVSLTDAAPVNLIVTRPEKRRGRPSKIKKSEEFCHAKS